MTDKRLRDFGFRGAPHTRGCLRRGWLAQLLSDHAGCWRLDVRIGGSETEFEVRVPRPLGEHDIERIAHTPAIHSSSRTRTPNFRPA